MRNVVQMSDLEELKLKKWGFKRSKNGKNWSNGSITIAKGEYYDNKFFFHCMFPAKTVRSESIEKLFSAIYDNLKMSKQKAEEDIKKYEKSLVKVEETIKTSQEL